MKSFIMMGMDMKQSGKILLMRFITASVDGSSFLGAASERSQVLCSSELPCPKDGCMDL